MKFLNWLKQYKATTEDEKKSKAEAYDSLIKHVFDNLRNIAICSTFAFSGVVILKNSKALTFDPNVNALLGFLILISAFFLLAWNMIHGVEKLIRPINGMKKAWFFIPFAAVYMCAVFIVFHASSLVQVQKLSLEPQETSIESGSYSLSKSQLDSENSSLKVDIVFQESIRAFLTLLAGLIVTSAGVGIYFRQKEYELVKQRYLEQCVDVLSSELEAALSAFSHNWARCLQILKEYKYLENEYDVQQLNTGFIEFSSSRFQRIAHHRMRSLIQTDVIWKVYQLALAFASMANSTATSEIPNIVKARLNGAIPTPHAEIVEEGFKVLKELEEKSHKFAYLLSTLQIIASELEQQKLALKSVQTFGKRQRIKDELERLVLLFATELEPYKNNSDFEGVFGEAKS